jgi:hypothetical protein
MPKILDWATGTVSLYLRNLVFIARSIAGACTLKQRDGKYMSDGIYWSARLLIIIGIITAAIGVLLLLSAKIPWLGRLPGDIVIQRKNVTFYFPVATSIILSIIITLVFWLLGRR